MLKQELEKSIEQPPQEESKEGEVEVIKEEKPLMGLGDSVHEDVCPICCDSYKEQDDVVVMPCNLKHIYHPQCIFEWLTKNLVCPLCKATVFDNV